MFNSLITIFFNLKYSSSCDFISETNRKHFSDDIEKSCSHAGLAMSKIQLLFMITHVSLIAFKCASYHHRYTGWAPFWAASARASSTSWCSRPRPRPWWSTRRRSPPPTERSARRTTPDDGGILLALHFLALQVICPLCFSNIYLVRSPFFPLWS